GTVRIRGKLTDDDPFDGVGTAWAIDHVRGGARHELSSGTCANSTTRFDEGRASERLTAVAVEPGDEICLQIRLRQGGAHYDITTVDLEIAAVDGSATWSLTRDLAGDFLAGNPHSDTLGHAAVWHFLDMAGSHRLERMPAADPLLKRVLAAFAQRSDAAN